MFDTQTFFDLSQFTEAELFADTTHVWDGLKNLKAYMERRVTHRLSHEALVDGVPLPKPLVFHNNRLRSARECTITYGDVNRGGLSVMENGQILDGASVLMAGVIFIGCRFSIGRGVLLESGALLKSPAIIGDHTEIRQGAYLRGHCLIGRRCVVGHATEVKHSIFLDDAKAGHFNYIGDSILGGNVNLGAGTKCANLRFLPGTIQLKDGKELIDTGLRKFGAILGDGAQTGCNAVTSPGTLLGQEAVVMPNATARSGYHPDRALLR